MTKLRPPRDLRDRTFEFGCSVVNFCRKFGAHSDAHRHLSRQLLDAGTSIGANLEEAKAARETLYWLRIIQACELAGHEQLEPLLDESNQLVAILTATVRTARRSIASS